VAEGATPTAALSSVGNVSYDGDDSCRTKPRPHGVKGENPTAFPWLLLHIAKLR